MRTNFTKFLTLTLSLFSFTILISQNWDNDAVGDINDIDDDNDGILDQYENFNCQSNYINEVFFTETFGAGTRTSTLYTNYCYEDGSGNLDCSPYTDQFLNDGEYFVDVAMTSNPNSSWLMHGDHTGNTNGRMLCVNAAIATGEFYRRTISGVIPNSTCEFSAWTKNIIKSTMTGRLTPNVLFVIEDLNGNVINSIATGDIPQDETWHQYNITFNVSQYSSFQLVMINNTIGGFGNDIVIDDIEFTQHLCDADGDGVPNIRDLDSDNDGIADIVEVGGVDVNADGLVDNAIDANNNGLIDTYDPAVGGTLLMPINTDGMNDGPNFADIDSDNDGIIDAIEGQLTTAYTMPLDIDSDGDGIDDAFDSNNGNSFITPVDTDGDLTKDYVDLDSDNDGIPDIIEAYDTDGDGTANTTPGNLDNDEDGLDDAFDIDNGSFLNLATSNNGGQLPTDFPDVINPGNDRDWREFNTLADTDGDGIIDNIDIDDDNDGITDVVEGGDVLDSDGDGIPNRIDLDSDNDGINDRVEGGGIDINNDGLVDNFNDANNDGWDDDEQIPFPVDTDIDGVRDFLDLDSDNDGIADLVEELNPDINHDGRIDNFNDLDGDGMDDDEMTTGTVNTDGDNNPDYRDLDSDNDGIADLVEELGNDANGDGMIDTFNDWNGDGMDDDEMTFGMVNSDNDNIPDYRDLDSDNDGIADIVEDGGHDNDGNGRIDDFNDANGDGMDDNDMTDGNQDTDGDLVDDYRDVDTDNDLIPDIIEDGGSDVNGDGRIDDFNDANGDGMDDNDMTTGTLDTDNDGTPDHEDLDSDNDTVNDILESDTDITDNDGDGMVDDFNDANGDGMDDDEFVNNPMDTDNDGDMDFQDVDDDNDGLLTADEWDADNDGTGPDDCDEDGIPNYLDPDGCGILIPEFISPNGDGINDVLEIKGLNMYAENKVEVFNRWGAIVYQKNNYTNDWNGTYQTTNQPLPTSTYYVVLKVTDELGNKETYVGYTQIAVK